MDMTRTHVAHDLTHDSPLLSCRFDPSGKFVFVGAQDYSVWRFEISSGSKTEFSADSWVRALAFSGDGQTVVTAGYDGRLMWWSVNAEHPTPLRTVDAHHSWIRALAVSPDGTLLASVGNDQVVRLWNMADGSPVREMSGHESYVYNVAFHPDGKQLATGDLMCNLIHWDVDSGKQQRTWQAKSLQKFDKTFVATIGGFRGMTFTPDGSQILCSGITNVTNAFAGVGNPSVVAFDWESGEQKIEHLSKGKIQGVAWGVAAHPDGTRIAATGGSGGYLLFWKSDAENEFHQMKLKDVARDLDLCSDGLHLAAAHYNGHVSIGKMDAEAKK
jgi:WD40 repeat protein